MDISTIRRTFLFFWIIILTALLRKNMRRSLWKVVHQKTTLKWFALLKLHAETKLLLNFTRFHVNSKNQNT